MGGMADTGASLESGAGTQQAGAKREQEAVSEHRSRPRSQAFVEFMASGWAPRQESLPQLAESARWAAARREALSAAFPGERLVIPAGGFKVRNNDCDYLFRPHSAFAHMTGLGADREPDAVLVLEPRAEGGHESVLYARPLLPRDSEASFSDSRYGEFWVGAAPTLESLAAELGVSTAHLDQFGDAVGKDLGAVSLRVLTGVDPVVDEQVAKARRDSANEQLLESAAEVDRQLEVKLSTMRLVKDEWEISQMREAVAATDTAFAAVVRQFPEAVRRGRGERWIEGTFGLYARHAGNGVGYDSICAAGDHANTLHWIKNTGEVREGDLVLIDAGVEVDSLFTADITRTLPVNGRFSPAQRKVYEAVLEAQEAGIAAAKPGATFKDVHEAAIAVIARYCEQWGLLPEGVSAQRSLQPDGQWHRRWMVHGTSHHLGLDVHDCQQALREDYMDGTLVPGMVLTVEPGLYFKADDELVPEEFRGVGVRIEDDIVITAEGCESLSKLPRSVDEVEAWMAPLLAGDA
ncbi:aminopeptidase P family protein [Dermatophilus congolensis]|nr:aminopeptidase P family protein [Dermatophilus congolensis]MBO3129685.1 aminopeptidase P family protein [Dermatophilus congolensis]MBO3131685.1 aminopeptidase P family protein [Dermatophilus congolensis]MBO3134160.1 aminopeptidase P family protein [Dermatophilus congolensis]MBO3136393.1 aminopeptidase P family protein [Dermatophilus congolensis]MBO3138642.1 aminopeptidase P family protein [Dermatophilus congolensis]